MAELDLPKFIKVLMLTTSDQDGEALAAIRAANAMLRRADSTWNDFARLKHATPPDPAVAWPKSHPSYSPPQPPQEPEIQSMLNYCLRHVTGRGRGFIQSLDQHFRQRGTLSQRQINALRMFYRNSRRYNR